MKHTIRTLFALLSAALVLLTACGEPTPPNATEPEDEPLSLTVALGETPDSLDPARCTTKGGETILFHLFENLMRWEDTGTGYAVLSPGQAESYTVETDYLGNATYTFILRSDIFWSDGQAVTAQQFVSAWQRLATPANAFPHSNLLRCISGYDAVQETGDSSLLGVYAADNRTLVVKLNGNPASFLYEVCAGAYTMPARSYLPGNAPITSITNGAYTSDGLTENGEMTVVLTKNESYYDADNVTAAEIRFIPSAGSAADYGKFQNGSIQFTTDLTASALESLAQNENWIPEAVTSTYGVVFNTLAAPFDSAEIRRALRLAVDEQAVIDALKVLTLRPAVGLVPYGVADYGICAAEKAHENTSDTSDKPPMVHTGANRDFRAHSEEIVTLNISTDHAANCEEARNLLAAAGYPNGSGFPQVEYLYIDTQENRTVAQVLQAAWKQELGITVTLRAVTAEEYSAMLVPGIQDETAAPTFMIAAAEFTVGNRYDVAAFLSRWCSGDAMNLAGYSSAAFDILLKTAKAAVAEETYDAYLHDAEAILLEDSPVIPLFCRGGSCALSESLTGMYRLPNGIYFFSRVHAK